jgi:UDP-GlcNAc:undecaprenyl-phosphate GlcNAc-1-phosphate transferase
MMMFLEPIASLVVALLVALYLAPILIRAAHRYGIVDHPSTALKTHKEPVPYLGGLVVFIGFLLSLTFTFEFEPQLLAILLAATLVVAVGLIDDLGTLTPRDKLIGQLIAAGVLVKAGVHLNLTSLPFAANAALSVLWILTCANAFNILDVSDGLATTAGAVGALGFAVVAAINGEPLVLTTTAALFGACLGFLWFNKEPARMYLGDTGSMLIGTLLGAFAMIGRYSETNDLSPLFVPLAVLGAPLFDLGLVILARLASGKVIWHGSPDHYAIRLKAAGWTARGVAWLTAVVGVLFGGAAIASVYLDDSWAAVVFGATALSGVAALVILLVRFPAPVRAALPQPADAPQLEEDASSSE